MGPTRIFELTLEVNGRPVTIEAEFRQRLDGSWENVHPITF